MNKSFIDAYEGRQVRLHMSDCDHGYCMNLLGGCYVEGLFLGLRYEKRFRCLGVETDSGRVVLVRLKSVLRVEPIVPTTENTEEPDDGGRQPDS